MQTANKICSTASIRVLENNIQNTEKKASFTMTLIFMITEKQTQSDRQRDRHKAREIEYLYGQDEDAARTDHIQKQHHGIILLLTVGIKHSLGHHTTLLTQTHHF